MELAMLVATQLSLNFSDAEKILFIVRKRNYDEIPYLRSQIDISQFYGEIQIINPLQELTDDILISGANGLLDRMVFEDLIEEDLTFYSRKCNGFEVLFTKRMEEIALSSKALSVVRSWGIPKSDGARVIECELID